MGITVLKKEDGFWLSFESSTGKSALVPITKLMPLPGITTRAVLSTCEECASKSEVAAHSTSDNKSSPKSLCITCKFGESCGARDMVRTIILLCNGYERA